MTEKVLYIFATISRCFGKTFVNGYRIEIRVKVQNREIVRVLVILLSETHINTII